MYGEENIEVAAKNKTEALAKARQHAEDSRLTTRGFQTAGLRLRSKIFPSLPRWKRRPQPEIRHYPDPTAGLAGKDYQRPAICSSCSQTTIASALATCSAGVVSARSHRSASISPAARTCCQALDICLLGRQRLRIGQNVEAVRPHTGRHKSGHSLDLAMSST